MRPKFESKVRHCITFCNNNNNKSFFYDIFRQRKQKIKAISKCTHRWPAKNMFYYHRNYVNRSNNNRRKKKDIINTIFLLRTIKFSHIHFRYYIWKRIIYLDLCFVFLFTHNAQQFFLIFSTNSLFFINFHKFDCFELQNNIHNFELDFPITQRKKM